MGVQVQARRLGMRGCKNKLMYASAGAHERNGAKQRGVRIKGPLSTATRETTHTEHPKKKSVEQTIEARMPGPRCRRNVRTT